LTGELPAVAAAAAGAAAARLAAAADVTTIIAAAASGLAAAAGTTAATAAAIGVAASQTEQLAQIERVPYRGCQHECHDERGNSQSGWHLSDPSGAAGARARGESASGPKISVPPDAARRYGAQRVS
jgi:hypothetical protein